MGVFVGVKVGVNVGVIVLVSVIVDVGVKVGLLPSRATNAQLIFPLESVAQFNLPTVVGVAVADGTEHGGTPVFGSFTPGDVCSTSRTPPLYRHIWL